VAKQQRSLSCRLWKRFFADDIPMIRGAFLVYRTSSSTLFTPLAGAHIYLFHSFRATRKKKGSARQSSTAFFCQEYTLLTHFYSMDAESSLGIGMIVHLSVGGRRFSTLRTTLCADPDSMLAKTFAEDSPFRSPLQDDDNGCFFLDRNPETFPYVLDYLRNGCRLLHEPPSTLLTGLGADAEYFGLTGLVNACSQRILACANEEKRIAGANKEKKYESKIDTFYGSRTKPKDDGSWKAVAMSVMGSDVSGFDCVVLKVRETIQE
jgi:hypothetical protein